MESFMENQFQSHPSSTNTTTTSSGLLRLRSAPTGGLDKGFDFISQPFLAGTTTHQSSSIPSRFLPAARDDDDDPDPPSSITSDGYSGFEPNQVSHHTQYRRPPQPGLVAEVPPSSMGLDQSTQLVRNGCRSGLTRQSSSPAGFFVAQNGGYNVTTTEAGVTGEYLRSGSGSRRETPPNQTRLSRLKSYTEFSSSLGHLPRIPEIGGTDSKERVHKKRYRDDVENGGDGTAEFMPFDSWSGGGGGGGGGSPSTSPPPLKHQGGGGRTTTLTHHLSLPRTAGEVAAVEKLLSFEDSVVPCKLRAKRGCATHPRSIAERVRRTRISEKMKKLQELVPNMDKQINTSDMLDLAVNYIKQLQDHFKVLSDSKARCRCQNAQ